MNNASPESDPRFTSGYRSLGVLARWALAAVFVYMGLSKALHPIEFLKLVRQYDLVSHPLLLNALSSMLPWFECFCGMLLLLGVAVRGVAVTLLLMLGTFIAAVLLRAWTLHETTGISLCAVRFDCGCGAGETLACRKLAENLILMVLAATPVIWPSRRFCLRHDLF